MLGGVLVATAEGDKTQDTDYRLDILFDRLMLIDLRHLISRFDETEFTVLVHAWESSKLILRVLKAVVILVRPEPTTDVEKCNWIRCLTVSVSTSCCFHLLTVLSLFSMPNCLV